VATNDKKNGLSLPVGVLQPTTRLDAGGADEGSESAAEVKATKARKRKATATATADKVEDMKLYLTEDVRFRLRMQAFKQGKKISTVANEVLDKALPRWTLERTEGFRFGNRIDSVVPKPHP
jgi:hypothetical protein